MGRIVHIQTQISSVFGTLDDEGNVLPFTNPDGSPAAITASLGKFSEAAFVEAFAGIQAERERLAPPAANRAQRRARAKAKPSPADSRRR